MISHVSYFWTRFAAGHIISGHSVGIDCGVTIKPLRAYLEGLLKNSERGQNWIRYMKIEFQQATTLPLPPGVNERKLLDWLKNVRVEGSGAEIDGYLASDFHRFVYTWNLFAKLGGHGKRAIEFGANPYFMSMLAEQFSEFEWTYSNWFGSRPDGRLLSQTVTYRDFHSDEQKSRLFEFYNFNSETDRFPFEDESYDLVLYCEILEHLTCDPCRPLRKVRNLLAPNGYLVLTTPNVARFENVARMISGENIYDPYSGYGPYGRHNREYTQDELRRLITYIGFEVEEMFTSDVHPHHYAYEGDLESLKKIVARRAGDLGQYIFVRARKSGVEGQKLPAWLYRSVANDRMALTDNDKLAALSAELRIQEWVGGEIGHPPRVLLKITNIGSSEWDFDNLRLGARAFIGDQIVREFRGQYTGKVVAGSAVCLGIDIDVSGLLRRDLEIVVDLVNENQFWFEDVGSHPLRVTALPHAPLIAELELLDRIGEGTTSTSFLLRVTNKGVSDWDFEDLRLGARAYVGDRLAREFRGDHTGKVAPGETVSLRIDVETSDLSDCELEVVIDLVNEHRFWFEDLGSTPLRTAI